MVDKENIRKILKDNKADLARRYHLTSIGIFGSYSRGGFHEDSDVDILIEYNQPFGVEFIDLADELEQILHCKVDLVSGKLRMITTYTQ